ncbi:hypothetical protein L207DRAFT_135855 [Hyaloscypha variabilis F]|uniref:Uncharacterized protein n=1 Tax=Hyaloscypha variabilis (strain UAMH 11265 / GT02V1 / F) TaxID=1149755 RepID=A0A2J6R6H5_HYAVF|nr:hypothetical protein L207DRAFT_135855 [Hyaloscypha variabilis F]
MAGTVIFRDLLRDFIVQRVRGRRCNICLTEEVTLILHLFLVAVICSTLPYDLLNYRVRKERRELKQSGFTRT